MRSWIRPVIAALQLAVIVVILLSCVLYSVVYIARWLDDTTYHIPAAVRIAHSWNPYAVDSPVDSHWFPAGAETLVAVLVWATGSLYVTNLSGALCAIAIAALMYRFAGLWSSDPLPRLATVACVCTIPLLIGQSLAFYIDIHLALLVCLSVYLQAVSLLRRDARYAYVGLTAAILTASVKYSGLQCVLVLAPASAFCVMRAAAPRRPRADAVALLAIALAFTAGWYVRNWMYRGNPIFSLAVPGWAQPLLSVSPAPYEADEVDPLHVRASPKTGWPHPWMPQSWLTHDYKPDMTHDAFGASAVVSLACTLVSLVLLPWLPAREREVWIFTVLLATLLVVTLPSQAHVPRYILCAPLLAGLSPAVLACVASRRAARGVIEVLCVGMLALSASYAYVNLLAPGTEWTKLRVAASYLWPYRPHGLRQVGYAQPGHLRIGYTSGQGNMIALLYDPHLTNELVPLHYRNYVYNHGHEVASPEEFVARVRALHLDYIHIFDEQYPGAALLRANFPDRVMPRQ
ncbi:MAG: hypothetical protein HYR72_12225 [Deltaproteobacteria bacterium]|nr:hypothetical protein [Deltaproteobacteria bacterium]MBI3387791.1 hypothetical protein [Deltaproteobacteria bacterium]